MSIILPLFQIGRPCCPARSGIQHLCVAPPRRVSTVWPNCRIYNAFDSVPNMRQAEVNHKAHAKMRQAKVGVALNGERRDVPRSGFRFNHDSSVYEQIDLKGVVYLYALVKDRDLNLALNTMSLLRELPRKRPLVDGFKKARAAQFPMDVDGSADDVFCNLLFFQHGIFHVLRSVVRQKYTGVAPDAQYQNISPGRPSVPFVAKRSPAPPRCAAPPRFKTNAKAWQNAEATASASRHGLAFRQGGENHTHQPTSSPGRPSVLSGAKRCPAPPRCAAPQRFKKNAEPWPNAEATASASRHGLAFRQGGESHAHHPASFPGRPSVLSGAKRSPASPRCAAPPRFIRNEAKAHR